MIVRAGRVIALSEELDVIAFVNVLSASIEVRLINRQHEGRHAVAAVVRTRRITVDTALCQVLALEQVTATLTDGNTYRVEGRLCNNKFQAVEHALTLNVGRIVAVRAGCIERRHFAVPLVNPQVRQLGRANGHKRIVCRVNNELEHGRTVASFRCLTVMIVRAGRVIALSEELDVIAFVNVLSASIEVRLINRQHEGRHAVAAVVRTRRITVDTALCQVLTPEQVTATLTDRHAYRIIYSLVNQQLDGVERALTVHVRRVVAVNTFGVERHRAACPFIGPDIRQLAFA